MRENMSVFKEYYPDAAEGDRDHICIELVQESLEKAKEAIKCDLSDGVSWYFLGNAHFALFFASDKLSNEKQNDLTVHLSSALKAYMRAEKDSVAGSLPDLYFNRGCILEYLEVGVWFSIFGTFKRVT